MKIFLKIASISYIFAALLPMSAWGASEPCECSPYSTNHTVSLDISGLAGGGLGAQYEFAINDFMVGTVNATVQSRALSFLPNLALVTAQYLNSSLIPSLSIIPSAGVMFSYENYYVEPRLGLGFLRLSEPIIRDSKDLFVIKPALIIGFRKFFQSGLYLNVGLGVAGRFYPGQAWPKSLVQPDGTLALGYSW